ncbi:MAG TPA: PAS domain-containing protein, partial [Candidatus Saccharimonadales bacterium]|nr:PAS domain-containing protein [Candidatus Saccharimonadales bacterium]
MKALTLPVGLYVWFLKPKNKLKGGLAVSDQVEKNSRLSSDFILGAIEDGVIMTDHQGRVNLLNPGAAQMTGWEAKE